MAQDLGGRTEATKASVAVRQSRAGAAPSPLRSRDDYRAHYAELRASQGLSPEMSHEAADTIAQILLRRRYPASVMEMRRRSQRWGNSGKEAA